MNPWLAKEDVVWKVKINYVTNCFMSIWADPDREKNGFISSLLQVVICFDGNYLIKDIYLSISYLFDEFKST